MERSTYFDSVSKCRSPLLDLASALEGVAKAIQRDATQELLGFADHLEGLNNHSAKARAEFIRLQIRGIDTEDLFESYRESWGIPRFEDDLVRVTDFKNGFLWTFRDHSSSWNEDTEARNWFYAHVEARFARRYEFWSCDRGPEEMLLMESGDYKHLLTAIVTKHADFSPLVSDVFSRNELRAFYDNHDENENGFAKESLLEILQQNINW